MPDTGNPASIRPLHQLLYYSRQAFPDVTDIDHEVGLIIRASIANNRLADITGLLLVHQGWFVQILEGRLEAIQTTYGRIARDPRHTGATIIAVGPAEARQFGAWNMCARRMNETDSQILDVLDQRGVFDPAKLTPANALKLLLAVARIQKGEEDPA